MAIAAEGGAPTPVGKVTRTKQAVKSAQTRARLIDATIRCLVKRGYAGTTTPQVAAEARLSRGAMLHHFDNGTELIKAAIVELHERRLRAFRRAAETPGHDVGALVHTYWRQLQKPGFIALHELALAARTSRELAELLLPLQAEFAERFTAEAIALFPEWQGNPEGFAVAMALSQSMLEGMAINVATGAMREELVEPLLTLVERQIRALNPVPAPAPTEPPRRAPRPRSRST